MPEPRVYDAEEAAAVLHCRPSWLKEQARQRRISFLLVGRSYRWTAEQLEQIVAQFTVNPVKSSLVARRTPQTISDRAVPVLRARPPRRARHLDGGGNAVA